VNAPDQLKQPTNDDRESVIPQTRKPIIIEKQVLYVMASIFLTEQTQNKGIRHSSYLLLSTAHNASILSERDANPFVLCREFSQAGTDQQTARLDEMTSCVKRLQFLSTAVNLTC